MYRQMHPSIQQSSVPEVSWANQSSYKSPRLFLLQRRPIKRALFCRHVQHILYVMFIYKLTIRIHIESRNSSEFQGGSKLQPEWCASEHNDPKHQFPFYSEVVLWRGGNQAHRCAMTEPKLKSNRRHVGVQCYQSAGAETKQHARALELDGRKHWKE